MAPILPRQSNNNNGDAILPTTYSGFSSSPDPGVVAGIVLGSVGGFLLILALLYSCLGWAPIAFSRSSPAHASDDYSVRSRSVLSFRTRTTSQHNKHKHHNHRRPSARATEMFEVRTSERTSRPPPPVHHAPSRGGSVRVETVHPPPPRAVRESSSSASDDEVVVIEERTPPRRKSSHRHSGGSRRADERRGSRRYSRDY